MNWTSTECPETINRHSNFRPPCSRTYLLHPHRTLVPSCSIVFHRCVNDSSSVPLCSKGLLYVSSDLLLFTQSLFQRLACSSGSAPACSQECTIEKALHRKPSQQFQPVIRSSLSSPIYFFLFLSSPVETLSLKTT